MSQYETGFIVSPQLAEDETTKLIQQMAEVVAQKKGRLIKQDVWGKRRLAYSIKRQNEGVYVFFTYEGGGDIPQELERRFKQIDTIIRYLTVKRDARDLVRRKKKAAAGAEAPAEGAGTPPAESREEK
ncbi:MAG: 30S ribosomal protein S6 [Candidatus Aminicenantes bacterium]|nr:30S ribosomal protein S6 [Candidatus Aminicenantes bacterium]